VGQPETAREQRQRWRQAPHRAAVRSTRFESHHAVLAAAHTQHAENAAHPADQEVQLGGHRALYRGAASLRHHGERWRIEDRRSDDDQSRESRESRVAEDEEEVRSGNRESSGQVDIIREEERARATN